jgi:hypothetical protein
MSDDRLSIMSDYHLELSSCGISTYLVDIGGTATEMMRKRGGDLAEYSLKYNLRDLDRPGDVA